MKIALCYPSVLPQRGGCETYIARLAGRLVADGHEVHLFASHWDATALPAGLCYHRIELPTLPRFLRPWSFSRACQRLLAAEQLDVSVGFDKITGVDVYYPQGGDYDASVKMSLGKHRWALMRGLLHAMKWFEPAHLSFLALERDQYRRPGSLIVAISGMVRGHLIERHGLPAERVPLLPIGIPAARTHQEVTPTRRAELRAGWNVGPDDVVAVFAAMNYRLKGLSPLLRALARLGDRRLHLVVAGKSSQFEYRFMARRLGLTDRVHFLGYCRNMREVYAASDLLVHPTFYDPCSNVVLEALAGGLPVITTRCNGASELMHPNGPDGQCLEGFVLEKPHDHRRLARALGQLLDPQLRAACAAEALRAAQQWTFEHHYQGLLAILRRAAGSTVSGGAALAG